MTDDRPLDPSPVESEDTAFVRSAMPLCRLLGVRARRLDPTEVVLDLPWRADLCTVGSALHGGASMALADSAAATCAHLNLPDGAVGTTTIETKTNFFRAVTTGVAVATSRPLHVGRTTIVVETEVRADDRLVAKTTQTQAVLTSRSDRKDTDGV